MVYFPEGQHSIRANGMPWIRWLGRIFILESNNMIGSITYVGKFVQVLLQTVLLCQYTNDYKTMLDFAATYPIPLIAVIKMSVLLLNRHRVEALHKMIDFEFWDVSVASAQAINKINGRFRFANFVLISFLCTNMTFTLCFILFSFIPMPEGQMRRLPTAIYFPWDTDKSPLHEVLSVVLTFNLFMTTAGNVFFDYFFFYVAQQLCAQFVLLKDLVQNLTDGIMTDKEDNEKFNSEEFQKTVAKRLKICVAHHNLLLRCGKELAQISSVILGVQVLLIYIALTITGFVLTDNADQMRKSVLLLVLVAVAMTEVILFAVQSTMLQEESITIPQAIAQCNWYLMKPPLVRGLTLIVMNSRTGIVMVGCGMVKINNELIVIVTQRVFSAVTLLQTLTDH